jgi:hypothetical protein
MALTFCLPFNHHNQVNSEVNFGVFNRKVNHPCRVIALVDADKRMVRKMGHQNNQNNRQVTNQTQ